MTSGGDPANQWLDAKPQSADYEEQTCKNLLQGISPNKPFCLRVFCTGLTDGFAYLGMGCAFSEFNPKITGMGRGGGGGGGTEMQNAPAGLN